MKDRKTGQIPAWPIAVSVLLIAALFFILAVGIEKAWNYLWGWWDVYP